MHWGGRITVMNLELMIAVIIIGFIFIVWFINKKLTELTQQQKPSDDLLEYLKTTNTRMDEQNKQFTRVMTSSTRDLNERLDNAGRVIAQVQRNLGEMSEIGRGMKELQQFLQSPKLRGNIGEQVLKDLITQMFPKSSFHLQYAFKSGEKVDAAIKTGAGVLPIDSKFPMENFQKMSATETEKDRDFYQKLFVRDIKKHILDISRKYILPEEGTMDFALMYIPSEGVYYEVVNVEELMNIAQKARVYPVSPTTLYAHLQTILLSFEGQKIEAKAKEVFSLLRAIQKDYSKVEDNMSVLQKHLNNAYNMMTNVLTSFTLLGQKISSTKSLGEDTNVDTSQETILDS
jgi:DNA recombination protein RmuC